jgi:hypothetical protein
MPDSPNGDTGGYADAVDQARALVANARLADPNDHFPYKKADARAAIAADMSPDPRNKDIDVTGEDVMSDRIADASAAYVDAQAAMLADPNPSNVAAYERARDELIAARREHRAGRVGPDGNPANGGAIIGTTSLPLPPHQKGQPRARRAGED